MRIKEGDVDGGRPGGQLPADQRRNLPHVESAAPLGGRRLSDAARRRLQKTLEQYQLTLDPADVIKEVSIFAERSDISEEIVRLRSHLEQFDQLLAAAGKLRAEVRVS